MILTHHFLIATPALKDPNFFRCVIYICEHNEKGAIGIIINRPVAVQLSEVLQSMDIKVDDPKTDEISLLFGGPLQQERGFVIHYPVGAWRSSLKLEDEVAVTTSRDILEAIARGEGPNNVLVALGYAGWGPQQLEQEMAGNEWLSARATLDVLFRTPFEQRWQAAAALVGVDITTMSGEIGHA